MVELVEIPVEVEAAAQIALAGLDATSFLLDELDPLERRTLQAVANRVLELRHDERKEQAILIANYILEGLFG